MTGGEEFDADVVILADGVNSLLAQQIGMKKELEQKDVAVGVKEVIELGEDVINERFGLSGNDGAVDDGWRPDGRQPRRRLHLHQQRQPVPGHRYDHQRYRPRRCQRTGHG